MSEEYEPDDPDWRYYTPPFDRMSKHRMREAVGLWIIKPHIVDVYDFLRLIKVWWQIFKKREWN
jgi:hypothetical protein